MAKYSINKGIGRGAEFRGLKSQYLFIFAGGLLLQFILFIVMYLTGIGQLFCITFNIAAASFLVWATFFMNKKYGEHGLMKLLAKGKHPRYIINRRRIDRLFNHTKNIVKL